jgi:hypothetical protein
MFLSRWCSGNIFSKSLALSPKRLNPRSTENAVGVKLAERVLRLLQFEVNPSLAVGDVRRALGLSRCRVTVSKLCVRRHSRFLQTIKHRF